MELALVVVALMVLGSLIPKEHALPREMAILKWGSRLGLPYSKENLKVLYRFPASWRVERILPNRNVLTQHFQVVPGAAPYYQTRKMY